MALLDEVRKINAFEASEDVQVSTPPTDPADPYGRGRGQLLRALRSGECVPLLGAGACHGHIALGGDIAEKWARRSGYPMHDQRDLSAVMQYLATMEYAGDAIQLKEDFLAEELMEAPAPDFTASDQIHAALAGFPLPLYVTTNYDGFMFEALRHAGKQPTEVISPWFDTDLDIDEPEDEPTPDRPWVYHLHGHHSEPQSLVLTEDDYIGFLVRLARGERHRDADARSRPVAQYVLERLRRKRLLFVGYSLRDWTFLVLFRTLLHGVLHGQHRTHVSVQVDPGERDPGQAKAYWERYMDHQRVQVFWESAQEFTTRLNDSQTGRREPADDDR